MTRTIVGSSLKFRLLVVFAAVGLIVIGVARLGGMRVDTYPEFTPPYVRSRRKRSACPPARWSS